MRRTSTLGSRGLRATLRPPPPLPGGPAAPPPPSFQPGDYVGMLVRPGLRVAPETTCGEVNLLFGEHPQESSLVVRLGVASVGLVVRHRFLQMMSGHYGWALYHRRPIIELLEERPLVIPPDMTLAEAATAILERDDEHRYDDVLVCERTGLLVGVLPVAAVLQRLATLHQQQAATTRNQLETERRSAEALRTSEGFLRAIMANAPVVLFAVDTGGIITLSEGRGHGPLRLPPGHAVGRHVTDVYRDIPEVVADVRRALLGEHVSTVVETGGRVLETVYSPLRDADGEVSSVLAVATDVTSYHRTAQDLQDALARERTTSERLRVLDQAKGTFLQAVSHDLRTPLATVLGVALTLQRSDGRLSDADHADLLARLTRNARKLDRLLGDLLDLDQLARDQISPQREPTDLAELVRQVVADTGLERTPHLDLHPVHLEVDRAKVERIVENLLTNAAKHTPPGTPVWVGSYPAGGGALLTVEDAGPGVPPELQTTIFEPFSRGVPGAVSGSGVGLALVARFAELHGGHARVTDRPGGGASFQVFLPHPDEAALPAGG